MQLVELVVQGLRGAPDVKRVAFGPGATLIPVTDLRDRELSRIVLELLYPKGQEPALTDLDEGKGNSRVALTLATHSGERWRLLMDLGNGRRALQKLGGEKPEMVSTSPAEIAQVVTAQLGVPQEDIMRVLLFTQLDDLPSRRPAPLGAATGGKTDKPLPPGFGDAAPRTDSDKPLPPGFGDETARPTVSAALLGKSEAELRARLDEVERAVGDQQGIKELEFELDGLQKKGFELDGKLKPLLTLRRSVEQAAEQVRRFAALRDLPADLVEKGDRLKRIRSEHDRELERLELEKKELIDSLGAGGVGLSQSVLAIAQRDQFVLFGSAAGAAAILLGVLGASMDSGLRWLALLDIPAFGVAVYGAFRVLGSLEDREVVKRRTHRIDDERRKTVERFRIDEEQLQGTLQKHGYTLEQLPDLQAQMLARDEARRLLEKSSVALTEAEQGGDAKALEREQQELQQRVRAIEEKLQAAGAGIGASTDVHAERDELLAALAALKNPSPAPAPAHSAPAPADRSITGTTPLPAAEDVVKRLLEVARDVFLSSVEELAQAMAPRASQVGSALTDARYREVRFGGRGECLVVEAATQATLPFTQLPAPDRDLIYLAAKIAVIEAVSKKQRLPVVMDRALDGFPDAKTDLLKRMLGFLGQLGQVVCITEKASFR